MTTYKTPYGEVYAGGRCKDDYDNIVLYDQNERGWPVIKLQRPAVKSLKDVEVAWARKTTPWKKRRHVRVTGSWRSCEFQRECWENDKNRFAHPDDTLHTRGLAIDVYNAGFFRSLLLKRILRRHGWNQSRPVDEPWHWSFHLTA